MIKQPSVSIWTEIYIGNIQDNIAVGGLYSNACVAYNMIAKYIGNFNGSETIFRVGDSGIDNFFFTDVRFSISVLVLFLQALKCS